MDLRYWAGAIIDKFEELLNKYDIILPNEDREGNEDEAAIYGTDYYQLEDEITNLLERLAATKNVRNNINCNSELKLFKDYDFDKIKQRNIENIEFDKPEDLGIIEHKQYCISAFLRLYKDNFYLVYNIHSNKDYRIIENNFISEEININKINNIDELEKMIKLKMADFFIENRNYIEEISTKLNERKTLECEDEEEL